MSCLCASHIGSEHGFRPLPGYKTVEYVSEGMRVIAPVREVAPELIPEKAKPTTGMWCVVAVAAGKHARVVNTKYGVAKWVHIDTLNVPR